MSVTTSPHSTGNGTLSSSTRPATAESKGTGWVTFAGVMFLLAAVFNAVWGIAALVNDQYFAVDELLFGDLSMWGVIALCVAAAQAVTALLVFARSGVGVFLGVFMASLSALFALLAIGAYPIWGVIIMVVDGLIIYGLTMYGFGDDDAS